MWGGGWGSWGGGWNDVGVMSWTDVWSDVRVMSCREDRSEVWKGEVIKRGLGRCMGEVIERARVK